MAVRPKKSPKVLVIEDNLINQKVIQMLLGQLGLEVKIVENGTKGLQAIEKNIYSAVFVDVGLPDISGLEVVAKLRSRTDEKAKWPVIILTAGGTQDDKKHALSNGVDVYLFKPITLNQIREAIEPYFPEQLVA